MLMSPCSDTLSPSLSRRGPRWLSCAPGTSPRKSPLPVKSLINPSVEELLESAMSQSELTRRCSDENLEAIIVFETSEGKVLASAGRWTISEYDAQALACGFLPTGTAREKILRHGLILKEQPETLVSESISDYTSSSDRKSRQLAGPSLSIAGRSAMPALTSMVRSRAKSVSFVPEEYAKVRTPSVEYGTIRTPGSTGTTVPALKAIETPAALKSCEECPPSTYRTCYTYDDDDDDDDEHSLTQRLHIIRWSPPLITARGPYPHNLTSAIAVQAILKGKNRTTLLSFPGGGGGSSSTTTPPDRVFVIIVVFMLPMLTPVVIPRIVRWLKNECGLYIPSYMPAQTNVPGIMSPLIKIRNN